MFEVEKRMVVEGGKQQASMRRRVGSQGEEGPRGRGSRDDPPVHRAVPVETRIVAPLAAAQVVFLRGL